MLRERYRSDTQDSSARWMSFKDGVVYQEWPEDLPCQVMRTAEYMLDVIGNKYDFNPVSHVKVNCISGELQQIVIPNAFGPIQTIGYSGRYLAQSIDQEFVLRHAGDINSNVGFLPSGAAGTFNRQLFDQIFDQIPESVSIANFIHELKDVKRLIPRLNGLRTVSDQYLNWSFGWDPLIRDIKALLTVVADVSKRLEHLKKINQRLVTMTHQRTFILWQDDSPHEYVPIQNGFDGEIPPLIGLKMSYQETKVRCNCQVYTDLDLRGADVFLKAMCSALGLMNFPKIIWNAIPFSFVVEWFINLDGFLDFFEVEPFQGTISIESSNCSFKTKTFYQGWAPLRAPDHHLDAGDMQQVSTVLVRGFHRRHGIPEGDIAGFNELTLKQQTLAAALIASNGGGRRRPRKR